MLNFKISMGDRSLLSIFFQSDLKSRECKIASIPNQIKPSELKPRQVKWSQPTNQPTNQPTKLTNQPTNKPTNQPNQPTN